MLQRGHSGRALFLQEQDYEHYYGLLCHVARRHGLTIWAYCLMADHVLLVGVPVAPDALARTLRDAQGGYARYLNRRTARPGQRLWHPRCYSTVLEPSCFRPAMRFVERNPVRAGLVQRPWEYRWSSAKGHCFEPEPVDDGQPWIADFRSRYPDMLIAETLDDIGPLHRWRDFLLVDDPLTAEHLRAALRTGRPCGGPAFLRRVEKELGRTLGKKRAGRKRKDS